MNKEEQNKTPLVDALLKYMKDGTVPFHTPGHKQGKGMASPLKEVLGKNALGIDLALMEELDDLHEPHGVIKEAQELAAKLYGADHSFFVINGTTGGIYAMILTVCGPGDKIIVPRNAHRSIVGGIILSGAIPVYMRPEVDEYLGLAMGVTPETVERTLEEHPDAKAVLLINPTYYGVATNLKKIVETVHQHNIPVLVDEAHGPHLRFHPELPLSALAAGADMCAQSTHKILAAMTGASLLHAMEERISVPRLKAMLQLVQTTSPSYVLMASLDMARRQMAAEGELLIARTVELARQARSRINQIPGLYSFGPEKIGQPGVYSLDPTKVTVTVRGIGLTGHEVERILRREYMVQAELSDVCNVLFIISLGDGQEEVDRLVEALADLVRKYGKHEELTAVAPNLREGAKLPEIPKQIVSPREALFAHRRRVPFAESADQVCAELITFYPPGIPIICPGEKITREIIEYCTVLRRAGLHVSGPEDATLSYIKVVE